jgi:hypothetical protein
MIAADLWRMALAGLLPLVDQHLLAVYAVAFGPAAGGVFFNPAASSVLPSLVEEDELVAANSGLWSAAAISQIALAPLAGVLVTTVGVGPASGSTNKWPNPAPNVGSAWDREGAEAPDMSWRGDTPAPHSREPTSMPPHIRHRSVERPALSRSALAVSPQSLPADAVSESRSGESGE